MKKIISKAATLLEALPYIQRFRSQVFVVKYGGSFMDSPDPEERHRVARDVVFLEAVGINPVVVHGGGKAITRALEEAGVKSEFVHGNTKLAQARPVDALICHGNDHMLDFGARGLHQTTEGHLCPAFGKLRYDM